MSKLPLSLLVYAVKIVHPKYNPFCFITYMIYTYCKVLKEQKLYSLQSANTSYLKKILGDNFWDLNNTIVVNGNFEQNSIKFIVVETDNDIIHRKVNVVQTDLAEKDVVLATKTLLYNLKNPKHCRLKNCTESMKFAETVELSLINTAQEWNNFTIDTCLKNYFRLPKLLYVGDVISVDLKQYCQQLFYFSDRITSINQTIHFKCCKIYNNGNSVNGGYLCAKNKTTLKQLSNVTSFIPKNMNSCPDGLQVYCDSIRKAVEAFFVKTPNSSFLPIFLLQGDKGCGKHLIIDCIATSFGMHLHTINNFDLSANVYAQNETKLRNACFNVKMAAPCVFVIKNFENFGKNNDGEYDDRLIRNFHTEMRKLCTKNAFPVIVFCCANSDNVPVDLKRVFLKVFDIKAPNSTEREQMLAWLLNTNKICSDLDVHKLANDTNGFLFGDLKALVHYAKTEFCLESEQLCEGSFRRALEFMQSNYNESIGAPKIPKVKWDDVGGLGDVKEEIVRTVKLTLKKSGFVKKSGLKRSGILLFGPPGTGKTLIAKAVATECGLCFLSVKGPELLNMYVGQSEQNVRTVFQRARDASPCIIFFDELDSLAPNRGASGDSAGVMDRVVSQLLAEIDSLNQSSSVIIIGATNRPDLIDPALLRPERIDKLMYVGPCIDDDSKFAVLKALTRKFKLENESILKDVVSSCPPNINGADFYGLCSNAWITAVRRLIEQSRNGNEKNLTADDIIVTLSDFTNSLRNLKPSVRKEDLDYFHKLQSELK